MKSDSRIYVAGHTGLAGSAILRRLLRAGYTNVITRSHSSLDLTQEDQVRAFFDAERPEFVFMAAGKVGGISAHAKEPANFIVDNLRMLMNVVEQARRTGVKRLLNLGSSCIYPRECPQPIKEEYLLTGELEPTNRSYALAKIAGVEICWAYNRQYGTRYMSVMPTNLYGARDNYDLETCHVLPALLRKVHDAKVAGEKRLVVWGSGRPRREFLISDDLADAVVFVMELCDEIYLPLVTNRVAPPLVNIGWGVDTSIRDLAETIMEVVGFKGEIVFDSSKPDGTPRKLLDVSRLTALGWSPSVRLRDGIAATYECFLEEHSSCAVAKVGGLYQPR